MSGADRPPAAVVMGLSPTGLHVARSLRAQGASVIGVADGLQAGNASNSIAQLIRDDGDAGRLLSALMKFAEAEAAKGFAKPVLVPSSDSYVEFVIAHHEQLAGCFAFQASYRDGLAARIMAKDSFAALCAEAGLAMPQSAERTRTSLLENPPAIPFPWMVKPAEIHRIKEAMAGSKGWIVRSAEELRSTADQIPEDAGVLVVQEIIPGPESEIVVTCCHASESGEIEQLFAARKLRQFPPGFGSASLVQSASEPEAEALTRTLLQSIGYRGIAAAEFKREPRSGELKIIEVNVRPSLWFSLSEAASRPVVAQAYRAMADLPALGEDAQQNGVRWRYALKDTASAAFYRKARDFVLPAPDLNAVGAASSTVFPVFAVSDPRPAIAEGINFLQKATRRVLSRGKRKAS